jgi:GntR family transcriptional regulator, transcriptional repressor for pyruvate dehydrogenase complex
MDLSDSSTVRFPDTWLHDVTEVWSLIATQSAADAAQNASGEQIRSLQHLLGELAAQTTPHPWESLAAAAYFGIGEASGNRVFETLVYDLWQALSHSGRRWDLGVRLWPTRRQVEESLQTVVAGIAGAEPELARAAMERHIRGVVGTAGA